MKKATRVISLRQSQRDAAVNVLLDSAETAIARRGYANVTMQDIAAGAECATGTLYLYFKSKEELLAAIIARHSKPMAAALFAAMAGVDNPVEKLRVKSRALIEYFNAHKTFFKVFFTATAPGPDCVQSRLRDAALQEYLGFKDAEIEVVRAAQARGLVRTDFTPATLVDYMHAVTYGMVGRWSIETEIPSVDEQARIVWGLQASGMGVKQTVATYTDQRAFELYAAPLAARSP